MEIVCASRFVDLEHQLLDAVVLDWHLVYGRPSCLGPHPDLEALHGRIRLTKHPVAEQAERRDWGHGRVSR